MNEKSASSTTLFISTGDDVSKVALFESKKLIDKLEWNGKGDLSETLILNIDKLLKSAEIEKNSMKKIAVFPGPGSYTGLRIGLTVANLLAWSLGIPIFEAEMVNEKLILKSEKPFVLPEYYSDPHITKPKK